MASSRLERLGTIYTRITGLMKRGAMKPEDKPLWYEIYEAFPPELEPRVDRPVPNITIKPIFYVEDSVRAKLHKTDTNLRRVNLSDSVNPSSTQQFISIYNKLKNDRKEDSEDALFDEALDLLKAQNIKLMDTEEKDQSKKLSIVDSFTEAKNKDSNSVSSRIKIKNIFRES